MGGLQSGGGSRQVTLETAGDARSYFTEARTVGGFLGELGIQFTEYDLVKPPPSAAIRPGLIVTYEKARRVYLADAGRAEVELMCPGETVCDLLAQLGLDVSPLDRVEPHPSTPLTDDLHVKITRVEVLDVTTERTIDPPLVVEADPALPRGHMVEVRAGRAGVAEEVTRHYYRNGEETARIDMGSRTIVEPQERVARVGVRSAPPLASRSGAHRDVLTMVATGYDPGVRSCGASADGRTATGHVATKGVCAVDPSVIPLGTEVWVEGYGYALACDTGGAIDGNRIDLCFDTYEEALRWGRRTVLVYILE